LYLKQHLQTHKDLYLILISWPIVGAILPVPAAIGWAVITFLLLLRTGAYSKILLALLTILLFSDSYLKPLSFASAAKIAVVVLLFLHIVTNFQKFKKYSNAPFVSFAPFLVYILLTNFWAQDFFTVVQKTVSYGIMFFLAPLIYLKAHDDSKTCWKDIIMFYGVFLAAGLILYFISPEAGTLADRFRGLMGNPNGMGTLLTLVAVLFFLFYQRHKTFFLDRPSVIFFVVVFVISLLLCGSRTALFAILIFLGFTRIRYFSNFVTLGVFVILMFSYNYIMTMVPEIAASLGLSEYLRVETLDEGSGRFVAWAFAWEQVQNVFFTGGGFGYTEFLYKKYYTYLSVLGHEGNAHNSYLTLWLDTGLLGILLFAAGLIRIILRVVKTSAYALPVFYSFLFSANFESWLAASLNPFTSLLLVSLTLLSQGDVIPLDRATSEQPAEIKPEIQ
jgi:O-antigen ligase